MLDIRINGKLAPLVIFYAALFFRLRPWTVRQIQLLWSAPSHRQAQPATTGKHNNAARDVLSHRRCRQQPEYLYSTAGSPRGRRYCRGWFSTTQYRVCTARLGTVGYGTGEVVFPVPTSPKWVEFHSKAVPICHNPIGIKMSPMIYFFLRCCLFCLTIDLTDNKTPTKEKPLPLWDYQWLINDVNPSAFRPAHGWSRSENQYLLRPGSASGKASERYPVNSWEEGSHGKKFQSHGIRSSLYSGAPEHQQTFADCGSQKNQIYESCWWRSE